MTCQLDVPHGRSPRNPQVLHRQTRTCKYAVYQEQRTANSCSPDRDPSLRFLLEVHVHNGVGEQEARDGILCLGLHPPSRQNKYKSCFNSPSTSCVWYQDHGHVDCVALGVDNSDDPKSLRWEGLTACLGREVEGLSENVEDGIEVSKGVIKSIWRLK